MMAPVLRQLEQVVPVVRGAGGDKRGLSQLFPCQNRPDIDVRRMGRQTIGDIYQAARHEGHHRGPIQEVCVDVIIGATREQPGNTYALAEMQQRHPPGSQVRMRAGEQREQCTEIRPRARQREVKMTPGNSRRGDRQQVGHT